MHTTTSLLTSFLALSLTSALPQPGLISTLSSLLSAPGVNPSSLKLTPGQSIDFTKVDAAPPTIIQSVPISGTEDTPTIQAASAVIAIAKTDVIDDTASALEHILKRGKRGVAARDELQKRDGDCSVQPAGKGPAVNRLVCFHFLPTFE